MFVFKAATASGGGASAGDLGVARTATLFFAFLAVLRAAPYVISKLRPAAI